VLKRHSLDLIASRFGFPTQQNQPFIKGTARVAEIGFVREGCCKYAAPTEMQKFYRIFATGGESIVVTIRRRNDMGQISRRGIARIRWLSGLLALIVMTGSGPFAHAQTSQTGRKQQIVRPANAKTAVISSGSGQYYIEFRSRFAWDYGHTYIVHGRIGETPTKASVAGLSPVGDDATAWVIGHYVPAPAETGWTDGDLEDKYVTSRYRVLVSKEQYDRILAHIRDQQSRSHMWSAELYNCNAFVGDVATFMGLKVPSSTLIYPKIFVNNRRKLPTS
jgi:hypothetical protein